ncbi:hypothetical protein [uncultured Paraglaciecola sp.]|uniref:hypothetical protein n=1 Tax=uncultured Paraglaciecola sp. TaxID=1765024 RepID=UPI0025E4D2F2|nr:hypothetical protein [uncultured Paraglaciecola sp.]
MKTYLAILLLCVASFSSHGAKKTIEWAITSFPPGYILNGSEKGKGYGDLLDAFMIKALTQYNHKIVEYPNWERQTKVLEGGPLVCNSLFFYQAPENRGKINGHYSISAPNAVFFLHDVVVRKSQRHKYGAKVSFRTLLNNKQFIFGYNRPYGTIYNQILGEYLGVPSNLDFGSIDSRDRLAYLNGADNIYIRVGGNLIGGMINMLRAGRVDYILEYDFMMKFQSKFLEFDDELVSIPVEEVYNKTSRGAYACSDTPDGRKAIAAINDILKHARPTEAYKRALNYLVSENKDVRYWKEYQKILNIYQ